MTDSILTKRTWILAVMVVVGLSLVWLIPNSGAFRESRLVEELPKELLGRLGVDLEISAKERGTLAADTTFARKRYYDTSAEADPYIDVSVVFSGKDINNSIHRPEVCLKAQGWNFESEKYVSIETNGYNIPFKEIVCSRIRTPNEKGVDKNSKGEAITDQMVQYYTFVGAEVIVAGHYERTFEDIKMRVLDGTDQQWAYITISMPVTKNDKDDTGVMKYFNDLNLQQTRAVMKDFQIKAMPLLLED